VKKKRMAGKEGEDGVRLGNRRGVWQRPRREGEIKASVTTFIGDRKRAKRKTEES